MMSNKQHDVQQTMKENTATYNMMSNKQWKKILPHTTWCPTNNERKYCHIQHDVQQTMKKNTATYNMMSNKQHDVQQTMKENTATYNMMSNKQWKKILPHTTWCPTNNERKYCHIQHDVLPHTTWCPTNNERKYCHIQHDFQQTMKENLTASLSGRAVVNHCAKILNFKTIYLLLRYFDQR